MLYKLWISTQLSGVKKPADQDPHCFRPHGDYIIICQLILIFIHFKKGIQNFEKLMQRMTPLQSV